MATGPKPSAPHDWFVFAFPLSAEAWDRFAVDSLLPPVHRQNPPGRSVAWPTGWSVS